MADVTGAIRHSSSQVHPRTPTPEDGPLEHLLAAVNLVLEATVETG